VHGGGSPCSSVKRQVCVRHEGSPQLDAGPPSLMAVAPNRVLRSCSPILLALQILVWGVAPILDARAEAESSQSVAHVEETGASSCPRVHPLSECQTCRTLGAGALTSPAGTRLLRRMRESCQLGRTGVAPQFAGLFGPLGSRAPPPA
jgi:hypothetical protein